MFGPLGGPELLLVFVIALIVFGPRKLPEIGKSLGKMLGEFRRASNDLKRTIEDEVEADKLRELTRVSYNDLDPPVPPRPGATTSQPSPATPAQPNPAQEAGDAQAQDAASPTSSTDGERDPSQGS